MVARAALVLAAFAACAPAGSNAYPQRPIRFVVPFAAGGATDIVARALGQRLTDAFGQTVVVDNRGGAGGIIGTDIAAKAAPDGYTLLMATAANPANAFLVKNLPHNFAKDLVPVSLVVLSPYMLLVNPAVAAKSTAELIALAKGRPGSLSFGSAGNGSSQHLVGAMFNRQAGTDIVHVPYKGTAPAFTDLISGQIHVVFGIFSGAQPFVKAGRMKALAVTSARRSNALPDIPTISESGLPGFDMSGWFGLLAPRGTPASAIDLISEHTARIVKTRDMSELLLGFGLDPVGNSPREFGEFIAKELDKYEKLVRASGLGAQTN
jgi:tripartite-type tricarboxylate transporter receptor subunit TctC